MLSTFSEEEWRLLEQRVERRGEKRPAAMLLVAKSLLATKGEAAFIDKQAVFMQLYPDRDYQDQLLREEYALLYAEVKEVLVDVAMTTKLPLRKLTLLQQLRERNLNAAYESEFKRAQKWYAEHIHHNEQDHWYGSELAQEGDQYFGARQVRQHDDNLQTKVDELDRYYVIRKLKESCEMYNRQHIVSAPYELRLINDVLKWVENGKEHLQLPIIEVYYHILLTLKDENAPVNFQKLLVLLKKYWKLFDRVEVRNMYRYAQNFCIRNINKGDRTYFEKLFNIYRELLDTKLILDNGYMDRTDYKNIATVALRFGEQQWVAHFLDDYKDLLPAKYRTETYALNKATYLYETGNYEAALDLLVNQEFDDIFYSLSARHLLLKIYYETSEFEAYTYQIESFRVYLQRNKKISSGNKSSNLNFLKVCRRLGALRQAMDYIQEPVFQKRLLSIRKVIDRYTPLANKQWLMNKADQLEQSY